MSDGAVDDNASVDVDAVRARFVDVGARVLAGSVAARDAAAVVDEASFRALFAALGAEGLFAPRALAARVAAIEGLAYGSGDAGVAVSACAQLVVVDVVHRFAAPSLRARLLPGLAAGTAVGACANAERDAGTDLMALRSRTAPTAAGRVLTARKHSVTNLGFADVALVSVRDVDAAAREAVNVYVVDGHAAGVCQGLRTDLAGLRTSPTGRLLARRAVVDDARVGARGDGVRLFRAMFSEERITTSALYLGILKNCRDRALRHIFDREQFGAPLAKNQYVQEKLVRMQVAIELLSHQLDAVVVAYAAGRPVHGSLSVLKLYGVDAALAAASDLVRLLGARGVSTDEPAMRFVRDLHALSILGGTAELMKMVIFDEMVKAR